jgi:uncharacterized membrane protein YhaH (DUF805 family)
MLTVLRVYAIVFIVSTTAKASARQRGTLNQPAAHAGGLRRDTWLVILVSGLASAASGARRDRDLQRPGVAVHLLTRRCVTFHTRHQVIQVSGLLVAPDAIAIVAIVAIVAILAHTQHGRQARQGGNHHIHGNHHLSARADTAARSAWSAQT